MKTTFELVLDLTNRIFTEREDHKVATILRLAADKIEEGGICPGGIYGQTLGDAGYWVVHTGQAPGEPLPQTDTVPAATARERWNGKAFVKAPRIDAFLADVLSVCDKHGFCLSHEDQHGSFEVVNRNYANDEWILSAHDLTTEPSEGLQKPLW